MEDVFYVYDERGKLVVWNSRLGDLFDLTDEELAGMTPPAFFVETDRPAVERAVREILAEGETVVEARANTSEGTIRFELTGRKLAGDDGELLGFCGVGRDVTDRRDQERRLAAQNHRLGEFATLLAHDLRNPLSVATGFVDLYRETGDGTALDRVSDALARIDAMVEEMLLVATHGRAATDVRPVDLDVVARDAWAMVDTPGATLDVRTDATVDADEPRLGRLFENLFRNAVQHAGPDVTVTVAATDGGFAVTDDGPGVDPADRGRVFDSGVSGVADGTGFGLAIVRAVAESHGWTVSLTEGSEGGARFEFVVSPCGAGDVELGM
ncbi:HTR-like protein [Candidatus Halobonum tyrrellensis G22]|uniref:histidine kinase n=1 Tax=Candidatus Halobonum tyrrellensis G22 TaxID=1324957 RepID=V4HCI3_9EURY|nr:HTR-like protein [Candidatus Halobonum tyrrellensis G22]